MKRFEDVVNSEFLNKYLPVAESLDGFVGKDGMIKFSALEDLFFSLNGGEKPNTFTYAFVHGKQNLIPSWNVPPQFRGQEERIYKVCLDNGETWQDVLGHENDKNVLL